MKGQEQRFYLQPVVTGTFLKVFDGFAAVKPSLLADMHSGCVCHVEQMVIEPSFAEDERCSQGKAAVKILVERAIKVIVKQRPAIRAGRFDTHAFHIDVEIQL